MEDERKTNKFSKETLTEILTQHKTQLKKPSDQWNTYAKQHHLPTYKVIKEVYGSWKTMKRKLDIEHDKEINSPSGQYWAKRIIRLITLHRKQLKLPTSEWDVYANKHNLPSSDILIYYFDSWENVQMTVEQVVNSGSSSFLESKSDDFVALFLKRKEQMEESVPPYLTSKQGEMIVVHQEHEEKKEKSVSSYVTLKQIEILAFLQYHKKQIEKPISEWNEYAKENELPNKDTISNYFSSWYNLRRMLGIETPQEKRRKEMIKQLSPHREQLRKPKKEWDKYATIYNLPRAYMIISCFHSWNEMRKELGIEK